MSVPRPLALLTATVISAIVIGACGSGDPQDANEPAGDYEVEITNSKFPTKQGLAGTSDLRLGVENTGTETVPELAFTIFTTQSGAGEAGGATDGTADGSFNVLSDQPGLENANRPVWVLENKFPRFADEPPPQGLSGGFRAQTNTFGFGPLQPGESREVVWRITPVQAGTYTLNYIVAAGLDGNAKAVTSSGEDVKGEFVVEISDEPPKARVNNQGKVVVQD